MTQPVPEESNEALDVTEQPPGTHDDDLPDERDDGHETEAERENAESSEGEPSGDN
ncbi:hypothetical protein GCM10009623_26110 [Nocardioides aestuarii]|uniref:Uncharacterized protein n=1 Tax=Nocardioides aestuarii TaxID=252231 RepID=A0ABW4TM54_9ACTN